MNMGRSSSRTSRSCVKRLAIDMVPTERSDPMPTDLDETVGIGHPIDRAILHLTEVMLFAIGVVFIALLCASVAGRYLFDMPLAFIEESSRILLVWFFMLGVGLAYRKRAHVAVEFFVERLPPRMRSRVAIVSTVIGIAFVAHVAAGGIIGLEAASRQTEPTLGISGLWSAMAVPTGALLLIYHQLHELIGQISRHLGQGK